MQQQSSQDRYLPIIINLESSNLLDEQTSTLLKTLILEENLDIFRLINSFIARAIDEQELCAKLIRLAQQMGTYMERPVSPIPKNKKQLL
jgi:EAL domain-containing protein (putative c-di-GMP-specific phosphodiesterase class I)